MSLFDLKLIERIRMVGGIPNDETCIEQLGASLPQAIAAIEREYLDVARVQEKPKAYEYKVQRRTLAELGNSNQRKVMNELLFILERRVVNHMKFPQEPDHHYIRKTPSGRDKYRVDTFFSDYQISGLHGRGLDSCCRVLMQQLETIDWQLTQRSLQPDSKCPPWLEPECNQLSKKELVVLVEKQMGLDSELLKKLRRFSKKYPTVVIETSEPLAVLTSFVKAMKVWLKSRKLKDRRLLSETPITEVHSERSTKALRRAALVKSCQRLYELTARQDITFTRDRTKCNRPRVSQFGSMCCLIAERLGEKRFAISTCESIFKADRSRAWIRNLIFEALVDKPNIARIKGSTMIANIQDVMAGKGMYIPSDDQLITEIKTTVNGLKKIKNHKKNMKKYTTHSGGD